MPKSSCRPRKWYRQTDKLTGKPTPTYHPNIVLGGIIMWKRHSLQANNCVLCKKVCSAKAWLRVLCFNENSNKTNLCLTTLWKRPFENIVGERENDSNQHFLLFPQSFLLYHREKLSFYQHLNCHLQILSIWACLKFCRLVKS